LVGSGNWSESDWETWAEDNTDNLAGDMKDWDDEDWDDWRKDMRKFNEL